MQGQLKEKNNIKIFILYLMREIDYPLEYSDLHDIVVQDGIVNSFDFADCFSELLDAGNVAEAHNDGVAYYVITQHGEHVAEHLQSSILRQVRERSLKSALRYLSFKSRGATLDCTINPRDDGRYDFHCEICERGDTLLNVNMIVETPKQAQRMKYNFDGNAEDIYRKIRMVLSSEN